MRNNNEIWSAGEATISDTNHFFNETAIPLRISRMNEADLLWCIHRSRQSIFPLEWSNARQDLEHDEYYNFCFKIISDSDRPEGGCICRYIPQTRKIVIEMLQSFAAEGAELDGKMTAYTLVTLLHFLKTIDGEGIFIENPINEETRQHYINKFHFKDIYGDGILLYRSAEDVATWISQWLQHNQGIEQADTLSDNSCNVN